MSQTCSPGWGGSSPAYARTFRHLVSVRVAQPVAGFMGMKLNAMPPMLSSAPELMPLMVAGSQQAFASVPQGSHLFVASLHLR